MSKIPKPTMMNYFLAALKKYADFNGRSRRSEFWYFELFTAVISTVAIIIQNYIHFYYLQNIFQLLFFIPGLAVAIRRMHDINKSGWYILIPLYNIILLFRIGDMGPNDYGPDPKDPLALDEIELIGNN